MKIVTGKTIDIIGAISTKENSLFNKNWICIITNKNYMILKKKRINSHTILAIHQAIIPVSWMDSKCCFPKNTFITGCGREKFNGICV